MYRKLGSVRDTPWVRTPPRGEVAIPIIYERVIGARKVLTYSRLQNVIDGDTIYEVPLSPLNYCFQANGDLLTRWHILTPSLGTYCGDSA